ncbi:hypothetical protein PF008_g6294 [Phytophthora fragariae]|uniref:Uncharacterized protein n=1 Tax=Phytophthora fragariae TaxID=53985 RepID=A0A6G0S6F8_9STRA|nr:hypothetical protein PF008_g6294 [Phytophthora fragariae]
MSDVFDNGSQVAAPRQLWPRLIADRDDKILRDIRMAVHSIEFSQGWHDDMIPSELIKIIDEPSPVCTPTSPKANAHLQKEPRSESAQGGPHLIVSPLERVCPSDGVELKRRYAKAKRCIGSEKALTGAVWSGRARRHPPC